MARRRSAEIHRVSRRTRQLGGAVAIAEVAEISDPPETWWQDMKEKAPDELVGGDLHVLGHALSKSGHE
jgi:hypothetical protein